VKAGWLLAWPCARVHVGCGPVQHGTPAPCAAALQPLRPCAAAPARRGRQEAEAWPLRVLEPRARRCLCAREQATGDERPGDGRWQPGGRRWPSLDQRLLVRTPPPPCAHGRRPMTNAPPAASLPRASLAADGNANASAGKALAAGGGGHPFPAPPSLRAGADSDANSRTGEAGTARVVPWRDADRATARVSLGGSGGDFGRGGYGWRVWQLIGDKNKCFWQKHRINAVFIGL